MCILPSIHPQALKYGRMLRGQGFEGWACVECKPQVLSFWSPPFLNETLNSFTSVRISVKSWPDVHNHNEHGC